MSMTDKQLKIFARSMSKRCKIRIVSESQIGWVVRRFRKYVLRQYSRFIPDLSGLLRPCIISVFRRLVAVLTFDVGDFSKFSWETQLRVIVHECQHGFDIRSYVREFKGRVSNWYRNYFTDDTFRAWSEGTPSTAEAEVIYYLLRNYPVPVCDYGAYFITDSSAIRTFREGCETRKHAVITQGDNWKPTQEAARIAIDILREMGL